MRRTVVLALLTLAWMIGPVVHVHDGPAPQPAPSPTITVSR